MSTSRRRFLATSATASAAALTTAAAAGTDPSPHPVITLKKGATVLLQGDSITDAGRNKTNLEPNNVEALGRGYAQLIGYHLLSKYPEKELRIFNRGISGNKVPDLDARWDRDCIELKPDVLSILIGVNDYWHTVAFGSQYKGTVESYGTGFEALLQRTRKALPDTRLVVCEPFVVREADGSTRADWFPEFDQRRAKAKAAAASAGALYVEFQQMFDAAVAAGYSAKELAGDAVHPTTPGHALMASRWLGDTGLA